MILCQFSLKTLLYFSVRVVAAGWCGLKQSHQQRFLKDRRSRTLSYPPWTQPAIHTWWSCWSATKYLCCLLVPLEQGRVYILKISWWTSCHLTNTFLCSSIFLPKHLPIRRRYIIYYRYKLLLSHEIQHAFEVLNRSQDIPIISCKVKVTHEVFNMRISKNKVTAEDRSNHLPTLYDTVSSPPSVMLYSVLCFLDHDLISDQIIYLSSTLVLGFDHVKTWQTKKRCLWSTCR